MMPMREPSSVEPDFRTGISYWPANRDWQLLEMTTGAALRHAAETVPDRIALIEVDDSGDGKRQWTYGELFDWALDFAAAMRATFEPGERVGVCANNIVEWIPIFYSAALAGLTVVTINPACRPRELRHILEKSQASGIFTLSDFRGSDCLANARAVQAELPHLREVIPMEELETFVARGDRDAMALPEVDPLDPCLILFTSGTTGQPKGVVLHHKGLLNMAHMCHFRGGLKDGGVFVSPMPMFYVGGIAHVGVGSVAHRATHVVVPRWDPLLFMRIVEKHRGTYSLAVPTMIEAVLAHPEFASHDLSSLTCMISGASVVEAELINRVRSQLGASLVNVYGQTEMHGVCVTTLRDDPIAKAISTIGRPMPHFDLMIADIGTGQAVPIGQEGEIRVRSFQNMIGYFGQPEETQQTITPEGWLRSGDLGRMDEDGYIAITGRIKVMIIRGGENIYPREIEGVLVDHPDVEAVAVVGIADDYYGEQVAAVIVPPDGRTVDFQALQDFARNNLMAFKVPSIWATVDAFPLTDSGKVRKFKLREDIEAGTIPATRLKLQRQPATQA